MAEVIVSASKDPERLRAMGARGRGHYLKYLGEAQTMARLSSLLTSLVDPVSRDASGETMASEYQEPRIP
jgi:hypothetical protein